MHSMKSITMPCKHKAGKIYQILSSIGTFSSYAEKPNEHSGWVDYREPFMLLKANSHPKRLLVKALTEKGLIVDIIIDYETEYIEEVKF